MIMYKIYICIYIFHLEFFVFLEVYYGGEAISTLEMPQSYTCPYCSRMGFTDVTLQEHVTADHQDTTFEVVKFNNLTILNFKLIIS